MVALLLAAAAAPAGAGSGSPRDIYAVYVTAQKAGDVEGMCGCVTEAKVKQLQGMPAARKKQVIEMVKMMAPVEYTVVSEEIRGDGATLTVSGKTTDFSGGLRDQKGVITFVKEGGAWKVASEKWR